MVVLTGAWRDTGRNSTSRKEDRRDSESCEYIHEQVLTGKHLNKYSSMSTEMYVVMFALCVCRQREF